MQHGSTDPCGRGGLEEVFMYSEG